MPLLTTQSAKGFGFGASGSALATDFVAIQTLVGTGSSGTINFSSIPQGYNHLQMRCTYAGSSIGFNYARVNGDSSANYNFRQTHWDGATISTGKGGSVIGMYGANSIGSTTYPTMYILDINDYSNTGKFKNFHSIGTAMTAIGGFKYWRSGYYPSTDAITSLQIVADAGSFTSNSIFTLYGIGVK